MSSHLSSSVSSSYVNPSFGLGGMLPPYSPFSVGEICIPQLNPMVGGWNPPSSGPNPSFIFLGSSAHRGGSFTSYIPSIYPSSVVPIPTNMFLMENLPMFSGVSSGGIQFYSMGNPPSQNSFFFGQHISSPE
jgi:hypothetical protein